MIEKKGGRESSKNWPNTIFAVKIGQTTILPIVYVCVTCFLHKKELTNDKHNIFPRTSVFFNQVHAISLGEKE